MIPPLLIIRFSIHAIFSQPCLHSHSIARDRKMRSSEERNSSDSMADPRASVKTVPRERLEGKTPRDAFELVGTLSRNSRHRFELVISPISLSFFLSNDPCRNPSWTKSRIEYIPRSRMFVPRSVKDDTEYFEISPFGLYY